MIKIRTALQGFLKSIHPRVYFQTAPKNAPYPYIVFDLPNALDDGEYQEQILVDVDGWDAPADGDTTVLENLMAAINSLNKTVLTIDGFIAPWQLIRDNMAVVFYLETKLALTDDDPRIKRRKYTYQAKLFKGE
jgi:hypothetical protein